METNMETAIDATQVAQVEVALHAPPEMSALILESERIAKEAIKHFNLTVKPENLIMTIQTRGRKQAYGWFFGGVWQNGKPEGVFHEINLCAEYLSTKNMGETILHELAHAENRILNIRDCTNRIHNKHFKTMAEKLGLIVLPRDKKVGWGFTDLNDEGRNFLKTVMFNEELFKCARINVTGRGKQPTRLQKLECPCCGYTIRVTRKWTDEGVPTCTGCDKLFEIMN